MCQSVRTLQSFVVLVLVKSCCPVLNVLNVHTSDNIYLYCKQIKKLSQKKICDVTDVVLISVVLVLKSWTQQNHLVRRRPKSLTQLSPANQNLASQGPWPRRPANQRQAGNQCQRMWRVQTRVRRHRRRLTLSRAESLSKVCITLELNIG